MVLRVSSTIAMVSRSARRRHALPFAVADNSCRKIQRGPFGREQSAGLAFPTVNRRWLAAPPEIAVDQPQSTADGGIHAMKLALDIRAAANDGYPRGR